ncbi:MAG: hypothetical protein COX29_04060 [Candidatus Moranbacteria bacterium CG23_combo_of_CG06-09_8_20_14_all_35_22]|nr:MAG: hypothetical protein COX29_04060 [Candidatus Moranbacteria bacterium CG23_combo_of_CG06-09_8_20_14_all_35_22]
MKIHLYQIAVIIVASLMIYQGLDRYFKKQKNQSFLKLLIRLIVWGGMIAIVIYPKASTSLAKFIGIEGNINAIILVGFILIFLIIFKLMNAIEHLEQQISILTRKDAIKKIND